MPPILFDVGYKDVTLEGFPIEVVYRISHKQIGVLFKEPVECVVEVELSHLRRRNIRNPYFPSIYGVACMGVGKYFSRNKGESGMDSAYRHWFSMLARVYKKEKGYEDCKIAEEWLNFQNFAEWWYSNPHHVNSFWCLDKDLLRGENRYSLYSPETCCIIPKEINSAIRSKSSGNKLLIGVSKTPSNKFVAQINTGNEKSPYLGTFETKEEAFKAYADAKTSHLKVLAEKWRDVISEGVYFALLNYEVSKE